MVLEKARSISFVLFLLFAGVMGVTPSLASDLPSFSGATGWINSPPLTDGSLRGKVVLIDFWEYTCVNCVRTFPVLSHYSFLKPPP